MIAANVINYLDQHQGATTALLTLVLICVTIYYALQNRKMVSEMAAAREAAVVPKLVLEWTMTSSTVALPTLHNVGPGPALRVNVMLHYAPLPGKQERAKTRPWKANMMVPGESKQFLPIESDFTGSMQTEEMANTYREILLTGRCEDILGNLHEISDGLEDIAEWRRVSGEAIARWLDPDSAKRQAKQNAEAMKPIFERLTAAVEALRRNS